MVVRRRYHFHWPGAVYTLITLLIGVGAINSQNNLLFLLFGAGAAGLLVSGIFSGSMMMRVSVRREVERSGSIGRPLHVRYHLTNSSRWLPAMAISIQELPSRGRSKRAWEPQLGSAVAFAAHCAARESIVVESIHWPVRRGRAELRGVVLWTTFPFGIVKKSVTILQRDTVIVRPEFVPLRKNTFTRWRGTDDRGVSTSTTRAAGDEFFGLREYVPGDSPRMIAWRASARAGELLMKESARHTSRRIWLVLQYADERPANGPEDALGEEEDAIRLCASLLVDAFQSGVSAGLMIPESGILVRPSRSEAHLGSMLDALGSIDLSAERIARGRAGVILPARQRDVVILIRTDRRSPSILRADWDLTSDDLARLRLPIVPKEAQGAA